MATSLDTDENDRRIAFSFTSASLVRAVLVAGAIFVVFVAATRATDALWWFAQSAVFAALAYPAVKWMGRRMPSFAAILLITVALLAVAGATLGVGLVELRDGAVRFRELVPPAMHELEKTDGIGHLAREFHISDAVDDFADGLVDRFHFTGTDVTGLAIKGVEDVSIGFIVWVLTVMLFFTGPSMARGVIRLFPARRQETAAAIAAAAYDRCTSYIGLTSLRAVATFAVVLGVSELLGLEMPALLAVIAALAAYFPYVGIVVGSLPVALMALLNSPVEALLVLLGAVVIQVLDAVFFQRFVRRHSTDLGLFMTMVAGLIGFALRGPGGAILFLVVATMIMAVVQDTGAMRSITGDHPADEPSGEAAGDSSEGVDHEGHGGDDQHPQDSPVEPASGETVT